MKRTLKSNRLKLQQGLSLVEILVVIIILLFGILSIVKVYPTGFLVMRNSSSVGRADRMDTAILGEAQADGSAPDGVYYTSSSVPAAFDPNALPINLSTPQNPITSPNSGATLTTDINTARFIYNEKVTIPTAPPASNPNGVPTVVLHYGPIYITPAEINSLVTGGPSALSAIDPTHMSVISTPWTEHDVAGAVADVPSDGEFDVDKTTYINNTYGPPAQLPTQVYALQFPRRLYPQVFYVDFTLANGTVQHDVLNLPAWDGKLNLGTTTPTTPDSPTNYDGDMVQIAGSNALPTPADFNQFGYFQQLPPLTWNAIKVSRVFIPAVKGIFATGPTDDPYQYTVPNGVATISPITYYSSDQIPNNVGGSSFSNANFGVLIFNPLIGSVLTGQTPKALVSYTVYDWHIIHDDQTVSPGNGTYTTVDLSVSGLKVPGEVQQDGSIYTNVVQDSYPLGGLFVVDMDTGEELTNVDTVLYDTSTSSASSSGVGIDYKNGKVTIPSGFLSSHPHLRFYFRTADDLGLALEKSPILFTSPAGTTLATMVSATNQSVPPTFSVTKITGQPTLIPEDASGLAASQYFISTAYNTSNKVDYVLLPPSMAGQTIDLHNITYYDNAGLQHYLDLQSILVGVAAATTTVSGTTVAYADLTNYLQNAATSAGVTRTGGAGFKVGEITAENTQAVCVWKENGKWKSHTLRLTSN